MIKRVIVAIAAAAVLVTLAACDGPTSGTITGKQYDPESTVYIEQCVSFGKYGCNVMIPEPDTSPECYELDLKNGDSAGSVCVDQNTFDKAKVGTQYP